MSPARDTQAFICDEMLGSLGKWLRIAGYDTLLAHPGVTDRALLMQAVRESRLLLTRDRKIMEMKDSAGHVLLLRGNALSDWLAQLAGALRLNWLYRPFSRCIRCNCELISGAAAQAVLPPDVRIGEQVVMHCPHCGRSYWHGGHVRRMRARLEQWQSRYSACHTVSDCI